LDLLPHPTENPDPETLFQASLAATPTQWIVWLEESLRLAYATGAVRYPRFRGGE
jgi:hypothetical protein